MKTNARFVKTILKAATENDTGVPWARGTRRAALIAKRRAASDAPHRRMA